MAYEIPGFSFTLPSGADYRTGAGQFRFVKVNSSGKAVASGAGGVSVGVRQMRPNLDEAMTIVNSGIVFVEAGGALAPGGPVASDATGRGVAAAGAAAVLGTALETASGAGIQIAVLLNPTAPAAA